MPIAQVNHPPAAATAPSASTRAALVVVTSLFFMWGFVTALNDVLIPHLKSIFDLNYAKASLIQFAFFAAYFVFSIPAARLIDAIGYKRTMVTGVLVMGAGALLFWPAAVVPSYPLFLGALMVLACGITILQVAANPYVAVLGPPKTASSRLNLSQAFNSLGTTVAPLLGGYLILNAAAKSMGELRQMAPDALQAYRVQEASSVKTPYLVIGLALIVLGFLISTFKLPPMPGAEHHKGDQGDSIWKYRHLVLGAIAIFVYVGAEVSIGSFLINYFSQPDIGNILPNEASKYLSAYWFSAMVGRFIGSAILQKVRTGKLLGIAAITCKPAGFHFHGKFRPSRDGEHDSHRAVQFHHVPQHLHAGHCGSWPAHRRRLRLAGHGDRRRSDRTALRRRSGRPHRTAALVHPARDLLPVHRVLRVQRFTSRHRERARHAGVEP